MFGNKQRQINLLTNDLWKAGETINRQNNRRDELVRMVSALRATRITYSVSTDMGWRPVYSMPLDMCLLAMKFTGQNGNDMPAGKLEIVSDWISPSMEYTEPMDGTESYGNNGED